MGVTDTSWTTCHGAYENAGPPDGTKEPGSDRRALLQEGDTHGGTAPPNLVTGCEDNFTQNGDLDFDGTPYYPDWPTSTVPNKFPSTFLQQQPRTVGGARYSKIQFETDLPASEMFTCAPNTPQGCTVPPRAPGTSTRTTRRLRSPGSACGSSAT